MHANNLKIYAETPKDSTQKLNKYEFSKVSGHKIVYKYLLQFFKQKMKYNKEKVKKKQFHLIHVKKDIPSQGCERHTHWKL